MQNDKLVEALEPCPFCGGEAERFTINEEGDNFGGDVICCKSCGASSHVEFGRKENLVSCWNRRATLSRSDDGAGEGLRNEIDRLLSVYSHEKAMNLGGGSANAKAIRDRLLDSLASLYAHPPAAVAGEGDKLLSAIKREADRANDVIRLNRHREGQGMITVATALHRIAEWAGRLSQPAADAAHPPADALREAFDAGFAACCAAVYVRTGQPIPEACDAEFDKAWDIHVANNPLSEAPSAGEG
nr:restriction alleviation protein, Lar family [Sphingobium sp.]